MSTDLSPPDRLPFELEPVGAVQVSKPVCEWMPAHDEHSGESGFDSACGQAWAWHDDGAAGKHPWNYCACCGRPVVIVEKD